MPDILPDNDVAGHVRGIVRILASERWRDLWQAVGCVVRTFEEFNLAQDASDRTVWQTCQARQILLITGNRNADGPDSLDLTIRECNRPDCLPVFTIARVQRLRRDRAYAERVAVRLLDYLLDVDNLRGTGRVYLP
jgi:hypothetical protein